MIGELFKGGARVGEETLVGEAEIVDGQPVFGRGRDAIFRAAAVAEGQNGASATGARERLCFRFSKGLQARIAAEAREVTFLKIAD